QEPGLVAGGAYPQPVAFHRNPCGSRQPAIGVAIAAADQQLHPALVGEQTYPAPERGFMLGTADCRADQSIHNYLLEPAGCGAKPGMAETAGLEAIGIGFLPDFPRRLSIAGFARRLLVRQAACPESAGYGRRHSRCRGESRCNDSAPVCGSTTRPKRRPGSTPPCSGTRG